MACSSSNPCLENNCTCENPCYDNCGCLNPTTFECVTSPGECEALGITDDMTGTEVIEQICTEVELIQEAQGKVLIDANDTCPEYLWDKLEEGVNISFTQTGTGCDRKLVINAVEGGTPPDVNVQVSADDTTTGYLYDKVDGGTYITKSILNSGGNEQLRLQVVPSTLVSADSGNQLTLGSDGKLKTLYSEPDGSETIITAGTGIQLSGAGTVADPYVLATNASIQVVRSCFDNVWRDVTLVASSNPNVVYVSGSPRYRYRFDGSIEFKGSATYTVDFGAYSTGNRKYTITIGNIPTTCVTLSEQAGTADLKSINYIDTPQASADQITQMYGYIIRKATQNIIVEFQSSFSASSTSKTIVVNFEGVISHPTL
jgi:hypothetical protein